LLDHNLVDKRDKIAENLDNKFSGFANELTSQERDDQEIFRTQLELEKERQLVADDAQLDLSMDATDEQRDLASEKEALRKKIESGDVDTDTKN